MALPQLLPSGSGSKASQKTSMGLGVIPQFMSYTREETTTSVEFASSATVSKITLPGLNSETRRFLQSSNNPYYKGKIPMPSPKSIRPHGVGLRGANLSRSSLLFGGPFGRIFRALPPADFGSTEKQTL